MTTLQETFQSNPVIPGEFRNEPPTDFSVEEERQNFLDALEEVRNQMPFEVPAIINGERIHTTEKIDSIDPSFKDVLIARSASCTAEHVRQAVRSARAAFPAWSRMPAEGRVDILRKAAKIIRKQRHFFAAVCVHEAGKPWKEADADVDEAIDFIEYYCRAALEVAGEHRLQPYILGEYNDMSYLPVGVVGVIGPWNLPCAIPTGMTVAALAAGNTAILKPSENTPLIAKLIVQAFEQAGLPKGVLNFIPGKGEVAGQELVVHPDVNMIVFTGSREVGLHIIREASVLREGQNFIKKTVTELGGKNAIIIDESADLDSAVPEVLYSAFGYSGQKCSACSRLIVLENLYDDCLERIKDGVESLKVGPSARPETQVGPLIEQAAVDKVLRFIELGKKSARLLISKEIGSLKDQGFFVPPTVFEVTSEKHELMQEEIFGPVLTIIKARDFDHALQIANSTPYALTGGVQSRTPSNLRRARVEFECGNLYLNRPITGAIVGRQPFGGYRLSGQGCKAGGPDYLKQFMVTRHVAENIMRHGFAPLE
ncbi:MAG: L-glutamate gamma-semialdehyde dehydrogenase [Candidatus Sumerlaeia bacterium]|nr:L-glutamate gamma-semialdehyde dehydrogenase [Candidatus Sumerlaeia bacterium]